MNTDEHILSHDYYFSLTILNLMKETFDSILKLILYCISVLRLLSDIRSNVPKVTKGN